jgi:hypothetical protein
MVFFQFSNSQTKTFRHERAYNDGFLGHTKQRRRIAQKLGNPRTNQNRPRILLQHRNCETIQKNDQSPLFSLSKTGKRLYDNLTSDKSLVGDAKAMVDFENHFIKKTRVRCTRDSAVGMFFLSL